MLRYDYPNFYPYISCETEQTPWMQFVGTSIEFPEGCAPIVTLNGSSVVQDCLKLCEVFKIKQSSKSWFMECEYTMLYFYAD